MLTIRQPDFPNWTEDNSIVLPVRNGGTQTYRGYRWPNDIFAVDQRITFTLTGTNTASGQTATDTFVLTITKNPPLVNSVTVSGSRYAGEGVHTIEWVVDDTDIYAPDEILIHRRRNDGSGYVFLYRTTATFGETTVRAPDVAGHYIYRVTARNDGGEDTRTDQINVLDRDDSSRVFDFTPSSTPPPKTPLRVRRQSQVTLRLKAMKPNTELVMENGLPASC